MADWSTNYGYTMSINFSIHIFYEFRFAFDRFFE